MVHKVLAPIKPTGGAIGIATIVGLAGAAACTQFLTLNMPFGGERRAIIFPARPISIPPPTRLAVRATVHGRPSPLDLGSCFVSTSTDAVERKRRDARVRQCRKPWSDREPSVRPTLTGWPYLRDISTDAILPPRPHDAGSLPHTVTNPEWAKATAELRKSSWEREGAPDRPVGLDPMKSPK